MADENVEKKEKKGWNKSKSEDEGAEKKASRPTGAKTEENPDFKYIVRLANTDLDGKYQVIPAIAQVKGLGTEFGRERVIDAPISEAAMVHCAAAFSGPVLMEMVMGGTRPWPYLNQSYDLKNGKLWPNERPGLGAPRLLMRGLVVGAVLAAAPVFAQAAAPLQPISSMWLRRMAPRSPRYRDLRSAASARRYAWSR